jgi:hypothetical protein
MATILHLARAGGPLQKLDPMLEQGEQELRVVYGAANFPIWVKQILPGIAADRAEQSPAEQLDDLWWQFCLGEALIYGKQFKPLRYVAEGVWELKTIDLRMFGWFPQKDHFIVVAAETKRRLVGARTYGQYIRQVVAFRDALDLDDPKFIPGTNPDDVVTNFSFTE